MAQKYLTPQQLVERWDGAVVLGTLANWRCKSAGPGFQKFGTKVRYPVEAVEAYERANFTGTAANDSTKEQAA